MDDLLRHTDALRALARGLLEDPHDAEDVVQEAWAASLEAEPRDLLAWLRGATRRLAARTLRSRARRRRREIAAARPEAIPEGAAEEADVLRALAAELSRLEEPYRTVLVLRYYRDLRPPEIAASLGIPLATVKTRLRRGLAILRARLGRSHRSWALVLAPLAARPMGPGLALAAAGALGVAALLFVGSGPGGAPASPRAAEVPARPGDVAAAAASAVETEEPQGSRAEILVEGPSGPVADAEVKVCPLGRLAEMTAARTDANGVARFDALPEGEYEARADAKGLVGVGAFVHFPGTTRIRLRTGCRLTLRLSPWPDPRWSAFRWSAHGPMQGRDLVFDAAEIDTGAWRAGVVSIQYWPAGGGAVRSIRIALPESGEIVHELHAPAAESTAIEVTDAETGALVTDWTASVVDVGSKEPRALERTAGAAFGVYRVAARGGLAAIDSPGYARSFVGLPRDGDAPARVALRRGTTLRVSFPPDVRPSEVRIYAGEGSKSVVLGNPVPPGLELNLSDESPSAAYLVRTVTAADAWIASGLPPESRLDVVGLDDAGLFAAREVETGPPGSEAEVEIRWPPTVRHRFLVRDGGGRPVPDAEIRILDATRMPGRDIYLGSVRTDATGRGSVRGLRPDRAYTAELIHDGGSERREILLSGPEGETVFTAVKKERETRRVLVLDAAGRPVAGARVQFGAKEGLGSFALTGDDGVAVGTLQPGSGLYLVDVLLEPLGGGDLETMYRPPDDDPIVYRCGVGKVRVHLDIEGEGLVHARLKGEKRDQELKVHVHGRGTAAFQLRVEPGEYRVEATLAGRTVQHAFVARSGEPAVVPLRFDR